MHAGVELDSAPASGDALRGGAPLPSGFSDSRPWIVGDAMVGAHDMLLPSLGGYFLSSFQFDASDSLATRSARDRSGRRDRSAHRDQGGLRRVRQRRQGRGSRQAFWVRAGRQFRLDGGGMFAYFDGVTVGYRTNGIDASAFVGQRVVLYVDTPARHRRSARRPRSISRRLNGIPLSIALDFLGLAINDGTVVNADGSIGEINCGGSSRSPRRPTRTRSCTSSSACASSTTDGEQRTRSGHQCRRDARGARARPRRRARSLEISPSLLVIGDVEQRLGGDLAYDLAAPSAVDVVDISRKLGVGLGAPIDALTVGARVD